MDCWPTLVDIERTHVLFMNAHYKPFVAIGYEYNKVKVQNGTAALNSSVEFSIPQFGDFFYDMVCHITFSGWGTFSGLTPKQGEGVTGTALNAPNEPTNYVDWTHNAFPYGVPVKPNLNPQPDQQGQARYYRVVRYDGGLLVNGGVGDYSTEAGIAELMGVPDCKSRQFNNLVRWVEYPANRVFKHVFFTVNNNPLDDYDEICNMMFQKFLVPPNKEAGYNRMVGQEIPHDGWSGTKPIQILTADTGVTQATNYLSPNIKDNPNPVSNTGHTSIITAPQLGDAWAENSVCWDENKANFTQYDGATTVTPNADALGFLPTGDPLVARYMYRIVDGPQTPKEWQPPLEMMHRLNFWFNEDVRLAIPSVSIPYGQRFIKIDLADADAVGVQEPGAFIESVDTSLGIIPLSDAGTADRTNGRYCYGPTTDAGLARQVARSVSTFYPYYRLLGNDPITINPMTLYINNIFVNPEIHDIFIRRIGFTLIRVHRFDTIPVNQAGVDEKHISQLKWPIEYIFIGMRPTWNTSKLNKWRWRDWHRLTKVDTGIFTGEGCTVDAYSAYTAKDGVALNGALQTNLIPAIAGVDPTTDIGNSAVHAYRLQRKDVQQTEFVYETPSVNSLKVQAHGINLYDFFNTLFYNSYLPYQYGGYNIRTPDDPGAMMISFCLFPRTYQPSGHLNVSRAREFFIGWESSYVSNAHPAQLVYCASAINFLLISDGSAVLRYST